MATDKPNLDFKIVQPKLTELLVATGNWIERTWPGKRPATKDHEGSGALFLALVRLSENSWRTAAYMCADIPKDPARRPEFALSVSPLARRVLEALCITVFVFSDLERRVAWFYRSGWREWREERDRIARRYGADPEWQEYLGSLERQLNQTGKLCSITAAENAEPSKIARFPIPDRMVKDKTLKADRRTHLQYLLDWYYRRMSQDAHLTWPGLSRQAAAFLPVMSDETRAELLAQQRSEIIANLAALELALVSELEIECRFGMASKAQYLWTVLGDYSPDTKELYEGFYRAHLEAAAKGKGH